MNFYSQGLFSPKTLIAISFLISKCAISLVLVTFNVSKAQKIYEMAMLTLHMERGSKSPAGAAIMIFLARKFKYFVV